MRKDRTLNGKGGLAILVRNGLNYLELTNNSITIELMKIEIKTKSEYIAISNCYIPPNQDVDSSELEKVFTSDKTSLIVGDLNAKNPYGEALHQMTWEIKL